MINMINHIFFKTNNMIKKLIYYFIFYFLFFSRLTFCHFFQKKKKKKKITFPNVACHATLANANVAWHATLAYGFEIFFFPLQFHILFHYIIFTS
jgi:hypothetical protein